MLGGVGVRWTSTAEVNVPGVMGVAATRTVLVWQIWQRDGSCAGGQWLLPGASTCGAVGAWSPGSIAGHTASAQTWTSSTMRLLARRMGDRWENIGRV